MQTPISFLLDLILDCQLPPDAQKKCRKYIRELETHQMAAVIPQRAGLSYQVNPVIGPTAQSASTQRLLDGPGGSLQAAPTHPALLPQGPSAIKAPALGVDKETGRVNISTGRGTIGPRKF